MNINKINNLLCDTMAHPPEGSSEKKMNINNIW